MNTSNTPTLATTCPACGLLCDDITLDATSKLPTNTSCSKSIQFFEHAYTASATPSLAGKNTDLASAIKAAAELLANSKQALFAGLGTEVQGMRRVLDLAEKVGATLDHMHGESSMRNTLALQNSGWQTTTLMEIKNRADVILAIGTDIVSSHPRFFERLVWNQDNLFDKATPEVIYLGAPATSKNLEAGNSPSASAATVIPAELAQLPEIINALNALMNKKTLKTEQVGGVAVESLVAVLDKLKNAKYAAIVWSAGNLKYKHAELTVQGITQLISKLNETSRAGGLPLSSGDGDSSVTNTCTWLSGYPTRNRFSPSKVEYNAHLYSTEQQLKSCDSLLWISSFNPYAPPATNAPTIVIGHPNTKFERMPDVFIPVGIPGVDHIGTMFRMDSSISLPLKKTRDSALPSLGQVIQQILDHMS